jgi:hypothetical protein
MPWKNAPLNLFLLWLALSNRAAFWQTRFTMYRPPTRKKSSMSKHNRERKRWAKDQLKDGDPFLHCGHMEKDYDPHHFLLCTDEPLHVRRPDGTELKARWLCACDHCWRNCHGDASRILIRGDDIWAGNEPAIYVDDESGTIC